MYGGVGLMTIADIKKPPHHVTAQRETFGMHAHIDLPKPCSHLVPW
jgi:hypothetical protein